MGETAIQSARIVFENGVERDTSISFFIEKALEDPEAEVYNAETGEEVESVDDLREPVTA